MSFKILINNTDAVNYLKSKFNSKYLLFLNDFISYKTIHCFSYFKIDNYAVTNIHCIYDYNDFISYINNNNVKMNEFNISKYL